VSRYCFTHRFPILEDAEVIARFVFRDNEGFRLVLFVLGESSSV